MNMVEGLPAEFALLRRELARISDSRLPQDRVHPLEAVLSLTVLAHMCGQCSLSAIYRFGDPRLRLQCRTPGDTTDAPARTQIGKPTAIRKGPRRPEGS